MSNKSFWDFAASCKYDVLREDRHSHLIKAALADEDTGVEPSPEGGFVLFGKEEALLVRPVSFALRCGLFLFYTFLRVIGEV